MFKAINRVDSRIFVSLDSRWEKDPSEIKSCCKSDEIICPWCLESVTFRLCNEKSSHFAHKTLKDCPFSKESPAVLEIRAVLYDFLVKKASVKSGWGVDLEVEFDPENKIKKKIDCLLRAGEKKFAYIIFDRSFKPEYRDILEDWLWRNKCSCNAIFALDTLKFVEDSPDEILLSTTARHYISKKEYDEYPLSTSENLGSLFFIDGKNRHLKIARRILPFHPPQIFSCEFRDEKLEKVLLSPATGEFVMPGEHEELKAQKKIEEEQIKRRLEEKQKQAEKLERIRREFLDRNGNETLEESSSEPQDNFDFSQKGPSEVIKIEAVESRSVFGPDALTCVICNRITTNWWFKDPTTKTCKCYDCYDRKKKEQK